MNKLDMESKDIVKDNLEYIKERFPEAITEENGELRINPDSLIQSLSSVVIDDKKEKYELTWPGKRQAIVEANTRTTKTLRPLKDKSVDFDKTENIYIEGDNLEALKILQESYLNKIKCIYIDPPYNTGNDFIYNDNFDKSTKEELIESGQIDELGNRLVTNNTSNGRFHSDWLSMMYPRLKLARNLLSKIGAIYISIDENEIINLRKICDEVFGERNFVASIKILSNSRGRQSSNFFAVSGEYVVVYAKDITNLEIIGDKPADSQIATYNKEDERGKYREMGLRKRGTDSRREDSPTLYFPIYYNPNTNEIQLENADGFVEIIPKLEDGSDGRWRWSKQKILSDKNDLICRTVNRNGSKEYDIFQKDYLKEDNTVKHKDFWIETEINYDRSAEELRELFNEKFFDYAKPLYLIKKIINTVVTKDENAIILDFFSGSGTTGQAVMELNSEDNGNRRYILIQIPEKIEHNEFQTICDYGEARIKKSSKKYINVDNGVKVFTVSSSNMKDEFYLTPDKVTQEQIKLFENNIKDDRTPEDLLTQVILNLGLKLDLPIEEKDMCGNKVFDIDDGELLACFDDNVNIDIIEKIAEIKPRQVVFRDSSFATDQDKVNFEERLKRLSAGTKFNVL